MAAPSRASYAPRKSNARNPLTRPPPPRAQSATPTLNGRVSPPESTTSTMMPLKSPARTTNVGLKRKERDFDKESAEEETNINVVVRCRGRNDREVRENSGVVVSTEGVKGKQVALSMGPSAVGNKTYNFDKVFSPAANQEMIFDEVVSPILDEVLSGFNCTIFAYGQTGTGKTYTMSGDITDSQPLPVGAGIIPRVLYGLFDRLGSEEGENSVKISFIELYNEELRDLLSNEDSAKLKIYDDNSKKGSTTTMVQGMEEAHIKSASKGLELLKLGSHKRQVAATKCNDLSSRSHSVFTVTVYMKRTSETGEDFVNAGKLNLVDLAGSENIQRSGAENKRAAEAGLINKSLLTLGRVINALVEKSSHIPYRESKLTRLLQDSLGGRTKTCIVATLSPARSNLEETISTLDYAFRAKNIKNKPQANQTMSKKTLLKEFTAEIEKLKSELMATRQRNGVYLTQEAYEEIQGESESRRILSEEQRDKIEILENSLRNKVQELFTLNSNFNGLKKDSEATKMTLDGTQSLLEKTEVVLGLTKKSLAEEAYVRKAHQKTEEALRDAGGEMLQSLESTTGDIRALHAKLRRRSDLHSINKEAWSARKTTAIRGTQSLDRQMGTLKEHQDSLLERLSNRMRSFVSDELTQLEQSRSFLSSKVDAFNHSQSEIDAQTSRAKDDMDLVLNEIATLREDVKHKVGAGMHDLSAAAQRISAGIAIELDAFHTQLHGSYSTLGREFKAVFDDMNRQLNEQKVEAERLHAELVAANEALAIANKASSAALVDAMNQERSIAAAERQTLLAGISDLIEQSSKRQNARVSAHLDNLASATSSAAEINTSTQASCLRGMRSWSETSQVTMQNLLNSRDNIKTRIKSDWSAANATSDSIKKTTEAVHSQTLDVVNAQMTAMDGQLVSLDDIISRVREQNQTHHATHVESLSRLACDVQESYTSIGAHMATSLDRTRTLSDDMNAHASDLSTAFTSLAPEAELRSALTQIQTDIAKSDMTDYVQTGSTPAKAVYTYPTVLPRTDSRDILLERMRGSKSPRLEQSSLSQPTNRRIYIDEPTPSADPGSEAMEIDDAPIRPSGRSLSRSNSLRELDPNTSVFAQATSTSASSAPVLPSITAEPARPTAKTTSKLPSTQARTAGAVGSTTSSPSLSASTRLPGPPTALARTKTAPATAPPSRGAQNGVSTAPVPAVLLPAEAEKENVQPPSAAAAEGEVKKIVENVVARSGLATTTATTAAAAGGGAGGIGGRRSARLTRGRGSE